MTRPTVGFTFFDPGWPALTTPYHDVLDFFYSGHIGNTFMHSFELYQQGETTFFYIAFAIHLSIWPLLIITRTHYWIDIITAYIVAHWCLMMSEPLSYILDVKLMGFGGKARKHHAYLPCYKCGYSNDNYSLAIGKDEKEFLERTSNIRKKVKL